MNSLWLTALLPVKPAYYFILIPATAIVSLLPDIDAIDAKIFYIGGGLLSMLRGTFKGKYFHHRGVLHSLLAGCVMFILTALVFQSLVTGLVLGLAYLSHPIIDGFNSGVGYFYPFNLKRYTLVPSKFCSPIKGKVNAILFIAGALGVTAFLLLMLPKLAPLDPTATPHDSVRFIPRN